MSGKGCKARTRLGVAVYPGQMELVSCLQVVVATGEGNLVCLDITENRLQERSHVKLTGEVSCIDITPLEDGDRSQLAAVGTWDMQVGCPCSSASLVDST